MAQRGVVMALLQCCEQFHPNFAVQAAVVAQKERGCHDNVTVL